MLEKALLYAWVLVQCCIGYHLFFPLAMYILYKLKGKKKLLPSNNKSEADYGIIVTAFEQNGGLEPVIASLLKLDYSNYLIYIVADNCDITGWDFASDKVIILRPPQVIRSNTGSHFYAINHFKRPHERLTIIDSDNLTDPAYLHQLNVYFDQGFVAVQGIRNAKNLDTEYAALDAARDIYYHFYDGEVLFGLGSSATLAGSGMAFTTQLYRECLENKPVSGAGFDKVLQSEILGRNIRIAFTHDAIVYDEKTSKTDQLVNQRARWINTWFKYFGLGFTILGKGIKNFSWNQFLFGLVLLRPPLFIFLILSFFLMIANIWIWPMLTFIWLAGFVCFLIGFIIPLTNVATDKRIWKSLVNIPKFIFYQLISLMNARKANKRSVATKHFHQTRID